MISFDRTVNDPTFVIAARLKLSRQACGSDFEAATVQVGASGGNGRVRIKAYADAADPFTVTLTVPAGRVIRWVGQAEELEILVASTDTTPTKLVGSAGRTNHAATLHRGSNLVLDHTINVPVAPAVEANLQTQTRKISVWAGATAGGPLTVTIWGQTLSGGWADLGSLSTTITAGDYLTIDTIPGQFQAIGFSTSVPDNVDLEVWEHLEWE